MNEVVISSDFFESFTKLDRSSQEKVKDFLNKFSRNPLSSGINFEKINTVADKQLYSARIDDAYRAIIYKEEKSTVYHILWIDHHDEAYDWAKRKTDIKIDRSNVSVINSEFYLSRGLSLTSSSKLFSKISTRNLMALGISLKDLPLIRSISTIESFYQLKDILPSDVYANLEWLAIDTHVQLIIDNNKRTKEMVLDFIKQEVLYPAINHSMLDEDIISSVKDTMSRIEAKKTVREIAEFFEDALIAKRGKEIYVEFQKLGLKGFEDIADDVRRLCLV
jgi:mRNA-degrading endonuclease RelE of RelBE toxin-antitoxin system